MCSAEGLWWYVVYDYFQAYGLGIVIIIACEVPEIVLADTYSYENSLLLLLLYTLATWQFCVKWRMRQRETDNRSPVSQYRNSSLYNSIHRLGWWRSHFQLPVGAYHPNTKVSSKIWLIDYNGFKLEGEIEGISLKLLKFPVNVRARGGGEGTGDFFLQEV